VCDLSRDVGEVCVPLSVLGAVPHHHIICHYVVLRLRLCSNYVTYIFIVILILQHSTLQTIKILNVYNISKKIKLSRYRYVGVKGERMYIW
jgi:hypothetical protein